MRPSRAKQKSLRSEIGDGLVVSINPARVVLHGGTRRPVAEMRQAKLQRYLPSAVVKTLRPSLKRREPFLIPSDCFPHPKPMNETIWIRKTADFIAQTGAVEDTIWYQELEADLHNNGAARHKDIVMRNLSDIQDFFASYVTPMIESLRQDGFKAEVTGYESTAMVDADGRLIKSDAGNHRFAICQVLGRPTFPLRVVAAHEDWYARKVMPHGDSWKSLQAALARVAADHQ